MTAFAQQNCHQSCGDLGLAALLENTGSESPCSLNPRRIMRALSVEIRQTLLDSDASINQLADKLTALFTQVSEVEAEGGAISSANAHGVHESVHDLIIDTQFYDRMRQRLEHVCEGLDAMHELCGKQGADEDDACRNFKFADQQAWLVLTEQLGKSIAKVPALEKSVVNGGMDTGGHDVVVSDIELF